MLTKRTGKGSHLEKLLAADLALKQKIESNSDSQFSAALKNGVPDSYDELDDSLNSSNYFHLTEVGLNAEINPEELLRLSGMNIEALVEQVTKDLRPRTNNPYNKKHKFMCPTCRALKFNNDTELREHLHTKHRNIVDLGFDITPSGHFKASKLLLINVLL